LCEEREEMIEGKAREESERGWREVKAGADTLMVLRVA
jgi:hypothetical protein